MYCRGKVRGKLWVKYSNCLFNSVEDGALFKNEQEYQPVVTSNDLRFAKLICRLAKNVHDFDI